MKHKISGLGGSGDEADVDEWQVAGGKRKVQKVLLPWAGDGIRVVWAEDSSFLATTFAQYHASDIVSVTELVEVLTRVFCDVWLSI